MRTIKVLAKDNIEEMLENPQDFVDTTADKVLVEIQYATNRILIMLGQNEDDNKYYLTSEDDEVSRDYYLEGTETLTDKFNWLINNITETNILP